MVTAARKLLPQAFIDFLYRHRDAKVLRWGRNRIAGMLGDPTRGIEIQRGPLAGFRFAFIDSVAMWAGGHEPAVQETIMRVVKPGATAFDIGGHVGYHVLLLAKIVGLSGKVVAFEPDPRNFELLCKNVQMNGLSERVTAYNKGMGAEHAFGKLTRGELTIMSRVDLKQPGETEISTIDREVLENGVPPPDFIIIDAQHQEVNILNGGREVLLKYRPIVIAQHEPYYVEKLVELMAGFGYTDEDIPLDTPGDTAHKLFTPTDTA